MHLCTHKIFSQVTQGNALRQLALCYKTSLMVLPVWHFIMPAMTKPRGLMDFVFNYVVYTECAVFHKQQDETRQDKTRREGHGKATQKNP